jgi:signal transduction histidine kinase/ActR/RegA family two-component response regulator
MATPDHEDELLRSTALQNANSILLVRQRAEQDLLLAKEALERKTAELAHSLSMMRATLESTTDGILVTDELSNITGHNENFVKMWNVPREVMETRSHHTLQNCVAPQLKDPELFLRRIGEIYTSSPAESFDILELADGRVYERFSRIQFIEDRNVGRVWSFLDVTSRTRAEAEREQLLASERIARAEAERANRTKDEFLATLSHELRTPLNAIMGWAAILKSNPDEEELREGVEVIERNARAQTRIIEDLLDMSRIISGKVRLDVQRIDLGDVVQAAVETVRPTAATKGVRLKTVIDSSTRHVSGDPNRLQQVFWNLLSNAVKFTPRGGRVHVVVERINSHFEVSISDTGEGIRSEFLPYVFDRFRQDDPSTTRHHGGLGLGLAIVKQLVELHGGSVRVKSDGVGQGTTFTVCLPVTPIHTEVSPRDAERTQHDGEPSLGMGGLPNLQVGGVKVLVVDDEPDTRAVVARMLEGLGASVRTAGSAHEAMAKLQSEIPNVLVSDIGMPDEDGYSLMRRIRLLDADRGGNVPAIALTAYARAEDRMKAVLAGFQMHLVKPVEGAELVTMVASLAGRTPKK